MAQPSSTPFESRADRRARQRASGNGSVGSRSRVWLWFICAILIIGGVVWVIMARTPAASQETSSGDRASASLVDSCTTDMATTFHIHPHLRIVIDGQEQSIPKDIGITSGCMRPLHTHDATGIIHVESPAKKDFAVSDIFRVWGQPYTSNTILDRTVTATQQLKLFVDGSEVTSGPETILRDRTSYVIMLGDAATPLTPPSNFQFPETL